jgi:hypothetical protein
MPNAKIQNCFATKMLQVLKSPFIDMIHLTPNGYGRQRKLLNVKNVTRYWINIICLWELMGGVLHLVSVQRSIQLWYTWSIILALLLCRSADLNHISGKSTDYTPVLAFRMLWRRAWNAIFKSLHLMVSNSCWSVIDPSFSEKVQELVLFWTQTNYLTSLHVGSNSKVALDNLFFPQSMDYDEGCG